MNAASDLRLPFVASWLRVRPGPCHHPAHAGFGLARRHKDTKENQSESERHPILVALKRPEGRATASPRRINLNSEIRPLRGCAAAREPSGSERGRAWLARPILLILVVLAVVLGGKSRTAAAESPVADPTSPLQSWLEHQTEMRTWSAKFTQTRRLPALKEPLIARGEVKFAAPNWFRWELGDPAQTIAVRGSNAMTVLYPRLRRAESYPLEAATSGPWKEALMLLESGFPRTLAEITDRFVVKESAALASEGWRTTLEPKSAGARRWVKSVVLEYRTSERGPRATELLFADGTSMRNDFTETRINPDLPAESFVTTVPSGFQLARPLAPSR